MLPAQWLPILAKRIDLEAPRVKLLKSYMDGNAPLPEAGDNVRESWQRFQRESRTNWGQLILEAVTDRIVPKGITVAGDSQSPVAKQAQRIWRDNRMDLVFQAWLRNGLAYKRSHFTCWRGPDGRAIITEDSPESMYAATDPLQPWRVRASLRCWRDIDQSLDFAMVFSEMGWQQFARPSMLTSNTGDTTLKTLVQGKWDEFSPFMETGKPPPVVVFNNPSGVGEYEPHLDVINRINNGILRRLTIEAMTAFRQRALKSKDGSIGLPKKDEHGNDIDYAKSFEPAPGAVWDLPPGLDLWESTPTDIGPLLMASKDDIRQLSAVTRTPLPILMPDNTNTSAAGANSAQDGYICKCGSRLTEAKIGVEAILVKALETEGVEGLDALTVEVLFEPVERVTLTEKYQAMQMGRAAGQPVQALEADVLGLSPEQIRQNDIRRTAEAMNTMFTQPPKAQPQMPPNDRTGNSRPQ
jgi:hypothetical protein